MEEMITSKLEAERPLVYHPETIRNAIAAAQEEASTIPLVEYDLDEEPPSSANSMLTIQLSDVTVPSFEFRDFTLDLTLSTPPSPSTSQSTVLQQPPSPPSSTKSSAHASTTAATAFGSSECKSRELPSPRLSPRLSPVTTTSLVRGSWPLIKYVGRGTPIDPRRRIEWGGSLGSDDVGEDGVLFSTVRSSSLDSAIRPSQRSISPEWNLISTTFANGAVRMASPLHMYNHIHPQNQTQAYTYAYATGALHSDRDQVPEAEASRIQLDGLESSSTEWASLINTLLDNAASNLAVQEDSSSSAPVPLSEQEALPPADANAVPGTQQDLASIVPPANDGVPAATTSTTGDAGVPDVGLQIDFGPGPERELDLGTVGGQGQGINFYELGHGAGRASPSVYSTPPSTPCLSRRSSSDSLSYPHLMGPRLSVRKRPWWRKVLSRFSRIGRLGHLLRPRSR